jgi:hypothetical protein
MYQPLNNGDAIAEFGNVIVTAKELADVLGLSEAAVYNLRRRGVIQSIRAKRSQFELGPAVRSYLQFKCGQDSESQADFYRERSLREWSNRELREILLEQTREKLHYAEDVRAVVTDSNNQIRTQTLAFADSLALEVAGKNDPAEIKTIIDRQVRKNF